MTSLAEIEDSGKMVLILSPNSLGKRGLTMLPSHSNVALKEWAVTVEALERGSQILLLRKGGISEESRDFRPIHSQFLLYPTFEHQRPELMKPHFAQTLQTTLDSKPDSSTVTFTHWAELKEAIELTDQAVMGRISEFHIWSDDYAESRLRWKPRSPLTAMLLRVYRLGKPQQIPYHSSFGGCKSWVQLESDIALGDLTPVISNEEFQSTESAIKRAAC